MPEMRVDLVAAPARYPRTPILLLLLIAAGPTFGLYLLASWSDGVADEYEAARDIAEVPAPSTTTTSDDGPEPAAEGRPGPPLATGLFDYRRAPGVVADIANANRLGESLRAVYAFMNDQSCAAVSVDGVPVAGFEPDRAVIPASALKVVVAAVALNVLGADHRFVTRVAANRPVDGVTDGDVYLIGGGDPVLTADDFPLDDEPYPAFNTTSLDRLADAFVAAGIERIRGTVIGDGTRYDDEWFVDSWGEGVAFESAGPYDALLANDARVLGRSSVQDDPNVAAAREFVRLLGNRGVQVGNGWGSGVASTTVPIIGEVESAPLSDIVTEMLVTSDNNTAEMLVKEIGLAVSGQGTRAAGLNAIDNTLQAWSVPVENVRIVDGSGLSPQNRLTCSALLAVLRQARAYDLVDALPVAGESGTLAEEFVGTPVAGRLHAKTGTLGNPPAEEDPPSAKALAGYLDTEDGPLIEFALLLNSPDISFDRNFEPLWNAFATQLATYPAGPPAAELGPR